MNSKYLWTRHPMEMELCHLYSSAQQLHHESHQLWFFDDFYEESVSVTSISRNTLRKTVFPNLTPIFGSGRLFKTSNLKYIGLTIRCRRKIFRHFFQKLQENTSTFILPLSILDPATFSFWVRRGTYPPGRQGERMPILM